MIGRFVEKLKMTRQGIPYSFFLRHHSVIMCWLSEC